MVLLIVRLRKSIVAKCSQYGESTIILLPVSVGHSGQEPLCLREPCANLAQNSGCLKSSRVKSQDYTQQFNSMSMAYYHSKSMASIQNLVYLN